MFAIFRSNSPDPAVEEMLLSLQKAGVSAKEFAVKKEYIRDAIIDPTLVVYNTSTGKVLFSDGYQQILRHKAFNSHFKRLVKQAADLVSQDVQQYMWLRLYNRWLCFLKKTQDAQVDENHGFAAQH
jgi:hypothetical protein